MARACPGLARGGGFEQTTRRVIAHLPAPSDAEALRGKRLLVVLGSYRSKRYIYERARELGVRLVVLDGPGHWVEGCAGPGGLVERHLVVDLLPFESFVDRAIAATKGTGWRLDGVGTVDAFGGAFAARIARSLDLPFHPVQAADRARDKHQAREACRRAGLPGPGFARIDGPGDIEAAAARVGFPAILKPVTGVGSVQTFKVRDLGELSDRCRRILAEVGQARAGDAAGLSSDRGWYGLMWSQGVGLLLESWIEGAKYDVDLLLDGGEAVYVRVTDDVELCGLRDLRRVAPSSLSALEESAVRDHAVACVRALGFSRGVFNVEVKRTSDGPRLIEVNGRLGGYSTADIHREVWGVDLVEQWLRLSLGLSPNAAPKSATGFVAESLLTSGHSGTVSRDGFLDSLPGQARVVAARPWAFAGEKVFGRETGAPDWLGALLVRGDSREAALVELERLTRSIDLPVDPGTERP
jgi:hypothetical protein